MRFFACANPSRRISRPQWLRASPSRRLVHSLLEAAFPNDVHPLAPSRREILDFFPADFYEKASRVHIRLRTYKDSKVHEMSLETALSKFAKPGHLLLPIPQPQKLRGKEPPQYHFKPMDKSTFSDHISKKKTQSKIIDIFPTRDDLLPFEARMVETWLLVKAAIRVQMQIHNEGPKDIEKLRRICMKNIHLRPDVILAAMPTHSGIIIDPQTDHEKVCWVMGGPVKHPERLAWVKPLSKAGEYYKRRNEVLRAAMDPEGYEAQQEEEKGHTRPREMRARRYQGEEQLTEGVSSELDFDDIGSQEEKDADMSASFVANEKQGIEGEKAGLSFTIEPEDFHNQKGANTSTSSKLNGDEVCDVEQAIDGTFPELEHEGLQGNGMDQAGHLSPETITDSGSAGTLSLEELEWEEYQELEVLTGMRPPPG